MAHIHAHTLDCTTSCTSLKVCIVAYELLFQHVWTISNCINRLLRKLHRKQDPHTKDGITGVDPSKENWYQRSSIAVYLLYVKYGFNQYKWGFGQQEIGEVANQTHIQTLSADQKDRGSQEKMYVTNWKGIITNKRSKTSSAYNSL